jgi:hypothetical protein
LAFAQLLDRYAIQSGVVEEQLTTLSLNEAKTLVHDQLLDRTLRHVRHSSKKQKREAQNGSRTVVRNPLPRTTIPTKNA